MGHDDIDFKGMYDSEPTNGKGKGKNGKRARDADEGGPARKYLKPWETLPAQLLNAYTRARWVDMSDRDVWEQVRKPLRTGAMWPLSIKLQVPVHFSYLV